MKQTGSDSRKTILLVDDDPAVLRMMRLILTDANYQVLTANNVWEGLQISADLQDEIHLLLSDFHTPVMTGIELAIRITRDRPRIKVLLMSGFPGGMLVLNEGWHFLAKPFLISQLTALVGGLIDTDRDSRFSARPDG
jgi:two-component system, cell cycle sensor histidine kinase and response regulator CckA